MSDDSPNIDRTSRHLNPRDAAALDLMVESGFADQGAGMSLSPVSALLALLASPPTDSAMLISGSGRSTLLVDVTMARVMRAGKPGLAGRLTADAHTGPALAAGAAEDLDAFVAGHWESQDRQSAAVALCELLSMGSAASDETSRRRLIDATLARVEQDVAETSNRFRMKPDSMGILSARSGFKLSDLAAVAAMLLIGFAMLWPMLGQLRAEAIESQCASNLSGAARGFSMYASDYHDRLPQATASFLGGLWWDVGTSGRSHSENLYRLVPGRYASLSDLACPGNRWAPVAQLNEHSADWRRIEEVSFSYQLFLPSRPTLGQSSRTILLTDKSPVVERARRGDYFDPDANSMNHAGRGQHLLFGDGSVRFEDSPILPSGDNIWLPNMRGRHPSLTGREVPESDRDAFVGP